MSVVAPSGAIAAPGPFTMLVEVTGPQRIEGVGLVMSINGAQSSEYWLARVGQGDSLWHVPDLDDEDPEPATAADTARALASLQPGDRVTYLLWAYDQAGAQTQYSGLSEAGSISFEVMSDASSGDGGPSADGGADLDGGSPADASVAPSPTVDAG